MLGMIADTGSRQRAVAIGRRCCGYRQRGGLGRDIVLVSEDAELLLLPRPRTLVDRLRGHVVVKVAHRTLGHTSPYVTASRLGRHPVRQMRELAHA